MPTNKAQALAGGFRILQQCSHLAVVLWQLLHESCDALDLPQRLRDQAMHRHVLQIHLEATLSAKSGIPLIPDLFATSLGMLRH